MTGHVGALYRFLTHRLTRYWASWAVALWLTWGVYYNARTSWDEPALQQPRNLIEQLRHALTPLFLPGETPETGRPDGNAGHSSIDFGGQYLFGRMLLQGHGRKLYDGPQLWRVAQEAWTPEAEAADSDGQRPFYSRDALLVDYFMGQGDLEQCGLLASLATPLSAATPLQLAVAYTATAPYHPEFWDDPHHLDILTRTHTRGPLYPPVNAFVYAGIAWLPPREAYFLFQYILVGLTVLAAFGIGYLTRGQVWTPVALSLIVLFPGYRAGLQLGQNAALSLCILVWGWALAVRGRPILGGMVWGLFAYKPVWAVAFWLVPLLARRWRMLAAMTATGILLAVATVPVVGVQSWKDWLKTGSEASKLYEVDENWIKLSRDLHGLPRRWLMNFQLPRDQRWDFASWLIGWWLWLAVLESTVRWTLARADRRPLTLGVPAGFLFLGAWLTTYHFMYYDALLAVMGVLLMLADRSAWLTPSVWVRGSPPPPPAPLHTPPPAPAPLHTPPPALPPELAPQTSLWYSNSWLLLSIVLLLLIEHQLHKLSITVILSLPSYVATTSIGSETATVSATHTAELHTTAYTPWDTYTLLGLWLWAGWWTIAGRPAPTPPPR
jgi:arabinofuranan 3-O-arabinosyltransferase